MLNSYCISLNVFLCMFLIAIITVRRHSPIQANNETHSFLLICYLSAAADIIDFADYNKHDIIIHVIGNHLIWGFYSFRNL